MQSKVIEKPLFADKPFPLAFQATENDFDYKSWIVENRDYLIQKQLEHGSLLFQNFGINTVAEFEECAALLCADLYSGYGDLPKRPNSPKLYHATPYTAALTIFFHNEASHTPEWPLKQFFYCIKAAPEGGALRVSDGRIVLKDLAPELVNMFIDKGLMYVRNFIPYCDVSWQDFFKVSDKTQLEAHLRAKDIQFEWQGDVLHTRQYAPAIVSHPVTKEKLWFNQIQLHHPAMLEERVYRGLMAMAGKESAFPRYVCFGDGTPISKEIVEEISRALDSQAVSILAKNGDVIFNDNMLVAHSRLPYKGDREVCVALGEPIKNSSMDTVEPICA